MQQLQKSGSITTKEKLPMSKSRKPANKAELLASIQAGYEQFAALLTSLRVEQMSTPGVNGSWSIKDNLAHLSAWQNYQAARLEGIPAGAEPSDPTSGLETEDEINEYFYQQYKARPVEAVLADFRSSYQRVLAATQALSWEALTSPFPWYDNDVPVVAYTIGNTTGHYKAHSEIIQHWLESQK